MFGMSKPPKAMKPVAARAGAEKLAARRGGVPAVTDQRVAIEIELTAAQHEKLLRLGGAEWIQKQIDKARAA